ncbi:ParA family protein [Subtercola boreus]|uniref:Cobyrinic acid a,c-diamide synthase n=1 Tax=Subtercola boreus TaxID=120213 RepID=A0A3E0W7A7_9MICO|nr:ParA family protein [Subtercola boreus]RFA18120.1 cobyrinic acid a,c-diamide synthase [Subtercola boreus]RFA18502.1 cobyrinic acid a,c-diamide synthase [Subtercola boreus]RFA25030.1 cobyrinic acid a,c-diamide synthase [Subtercola boreus]
MKVIAVYSTKGGVGKTTAAVNLAWEAAHDFRVLLWDLDPQGAATYLLQVKPKVKGGVAGLVDGRTRLGAAIRSTTINRLDVLPADTSYRDLDLTLDQNKKPSERIKRLLEAVTGDYDVVILDCPPGAGLVAENALHAADLVVVPLVPSPLSLRSLEQVTEFVHSSPSRPPVLAFLSMVDRRKTQHRDAVVTMPKENPVVSNIVVPSTVTIERMGSDRAPVGSFAPHTEAAHAYSELWVRIQSLIKARQRKRKHS